MVFRRSTSRGERNSGSRTNGRSSSGSNAWRADRTVRRGLHVELLDDRALLTITPDLIHPPTITPLVDPGTYLPVQYNLFDYNGYLTGPSSAPPVTIAENYLRSHAGTVGLSQADLNNYLITTNYVTQSTGATTLTFQQTVHGLPVTNANFNITVAADGRLLAVGGGFVPGLGQQPPAAPSPALTSSQAVSSVASALGVPLIGGPQLINSLPDGSSVYRASGISRDDIPTRMQYVAVPGGSVALVWNLIVRTPDSAHWYSVDVNAGSGQLIDVVDFMHPATYEVFAMPGRDPDDGPRTIETDPHIINPTPAPIPSPFGWHDTNGVAGAEFTITNGNNANAYTDRDADDQPDAGSQPDGGAGLDFTGALVPLDLTQQPDTYSAAAVVNLFYWNNILHDVHYLYGFDEAARNFQVNNYGRGGVGNDAVHAEAQDGSGTNNANFATPPDGMSGVMQMFEFTITTPNRDGDFDAEIVVHEYGHGVSNRLTGNAFGLNALQSGGMGEGWADWWGLMFTQKSASETIDGRGVGNYVLGLPSNGPGVRQFRYDFDISNVNLETFLNYGTGPGQDVEVHESGTRWSAALWDITHLFIEKYGYEPNIYNSTSDAGNIKALHLIMNALKVQPLNPTFIQARDAILMADQLLYGGANQFEIWTAFARRGLGDGASTPDSDSTVLTTSFEIPPELLSQIALGPDVALVEGNSGITNFVFSVTSTGELPSGPVTVQFTTVNGTAIAGSDYVAQSGTLTFEPAGNRTQLITVQILGDETVEPNETFQVQLSQQSIGVLTRAEATGTILNDDVDVVINDVSIVEGNSGTSNAVFTVSTFGVVNQTVTVSYTTTNGSAQGGTDYQPRGGVLTFVPGMTALNVSVPIVGDLLNEGAEAFFVMLSNSVNARLADPAGVAAITDNDPMPSLYISDALLSFIGPDEMAAVFTVALDNRSGRDVTMQFGTVDGSATSADSYQATSGTLTILPGAATTQITVPILGGAVIDPSEQFFLDLSGVLNAHVLDSRGVGTMTFGNPEPFDIVVDDGNPGFSGTGGWTNVTNLASYQSDYSHHAAGNGSATANWSFGNLPGGSYEVFTRWAPFSNRATNAPYTVLDGTATLGTAAVNQQIAPAGSQAHGLAWQSLGTYSVSTGTLNVRLADNANGIVIADAVRIVPAAGAPVGPEIDVTGSGQSIADGDTSPVDDDATHFGAVDLSGGSVIHTFTIHNTGSGALHLTGGPAVQISGPHAQDFTVISQPSGSVAPGGTTTFQIEFHPSADGLRHAAVSIVNDDADESLYDFVIQGTGGTAAAAPLFAQNAALPQDVNADGRVSPLDLVLVINTLILGSADGGAAGGATPLTAAASSSGSSAPLRYFPDVSGDGRVSPLDLVLVINYLLVPPPAARAAASAVAPSAAASAASSAGKSATTAAPAALVAVAVDQAIGTMSGPRETAGGGNTFQASLADDVALPNVPEDSAALLESQAVPAYFASHADEPDDESDVDALLVALAV